MGAGRLFVVATPIGNLEDITLRAIEVLRSVPLIACEDTRRTEQLLARLQIRTKKTSFHEHNEKEKTPLLLQHLKEGKDLALLSDAGTPLLSDPGTVLVAKALEADIRVVPIPGVSAPAAALSVSPLPRGRYHFYGFLPSRAGERRKALAALRHLAGEAIVFFESPRRLAGALADIIEILGDGDAVLAREMTKIHEEFLRGRASEILEKVRGKEVLGEITLIVTGIENAPQQEERAHAGESLTSHVERLEKEKNLSRKDAMRQAARERGLSRRRVYQELLKEKS
jgi:16S rRNA (cytidine1402-2'-O)-methyltransferase